MKEIIKKIIQKKSFPTILVLSTLMALLASFAVSFRQVDKSAGYEILKYILVIWSIYFLLFIIDFLKEYIKRNSKNPLH